MAAAAPASPPVLDIPLIHLPADGDIKDAAQMASLRQACLDHGFLLLSNRVADVTMPIGDDHGTSRAQGQQHHIPPAKLERMWQVARALFDVPLDAKRAVSVASSGAANRGYFSSLDHAEYNKDPNGLTIADNKEGFFFGSDSLLAPRSNRVPAGLEDLLPEVEEYMEAAAAVCSRVMRAIVRTGLLTNLAADEQASPDVFVARYLSDPVYMLKTLRYPPADGNTDAHTDYGCITLLLPGDKGLQVHWAGAYYDVPLVPDAFVINFGDLLKFWSGAAIKSTIHRVVYNSPEGRPRYSIPFFMHPQRGSKIFDGTETIDSYEYVLDRFDRTYKHRAAAAAAAASAPATTVPGIATPAA